MQKIDLKKHILKISLIFIVLICAFLCIYTVRNYKSSDTMIKNDQFKGEVNKSNNNQNTTENVPSSDGDVQLNKNGEVAPSNENRQPGQNGAAAQQNGNGQSRKGRNMQSGNTNTKYVPALSIYSAVFLVLCILFYYLFKCKNIKINLSDEKILLFTLLAVGFLLRISASTLMDGHNDIDLFKNWATSAANNILQVYSSSSIRSVDYPPLYIYVLALIGKIASVPAFSGYFILMLKIPSIIADIVTSYFIYKLGKKYLSPAISIFIAAFYIFNPAIFIDSTFWGQVDSFFTLFIVFAVYLLSEKKIVASSVILVASVLMKPQGIIFIPILFFELVRERNLKTLIKAAISGIITAIIVILPFSLSQQSPLWIFKLYSNTIAEYPYASVNAFNFFSLIGANYKKNTDTLFLFNYHTVGMMFIVAITLFSWFTYIKGNSRKFVSAIALLQIAGVFTFSAGMHERYLFPAVALSILAFIYLKDKRFFILSIGFSITSYINIFSLLFSVDASIFNILLKATSLINVLLVAYLVKIMFDTSVNKNFSKLIE